MFSPHRSYQIKYTVCSDFEVVRIFFLGFFKARDEAALGSEPQPGLGLGLGLGLVKVRVGVG